MKLYTRTGDDGTTGLFGGGRVRKDHPRVEAYGNVDELNAAIGFAAASCDGGRPLHDEFLSLMRVMQSRLFDLGADLATPAGSKHEVRVPRISEREVAQAEKWIDMMESFNEPLSSFVLPGGCELAARLHLARTICRRAERSMITLRDSDETISDAAIKFVNRLSDLLFAMARRANLDANVADVPWKPNEATDGNR